MKKIIYAYSSILIGCSLISFIGHFIQFGIFRLTPWIPATVGILLIFLVNKLKNNTTLFWISTWIVFGFGIMTINMAIAFIPQNSQLLRKKIIFSIMAVASVITFISLTRNHLKEDIS